ncbi:MAG: helicase C-terminal domain-containing protein [Romboutsia sp.]
MDNNTNTLVTYRHNIASLVNNVVFLDIEVSGINPIKSEILEIGAIKIKNKEGEILNTIINNKKEIPIEIYSICSGMNKNDFENAPTLENIKKDIEDFLEDNIIICHNIDNVKKFMNYYIPNVQNEIIDVMELSVILEPYHNDYSLDYLNKVMINKSNNQKNRALSDAIDTLNIVNALLMRLKKKEESTLEPLIFKINSYLKKYNLERWQWVNIIEDANYDIKLDLDINYEENVRPKNKEDKKEKEIVKNIYASDKCYEELLKNKDIWESKEGFMYEYRPGQYELTKTIRETFKENVGAKISCIEAPTGIGKSVGYLLPAIVEARINRKRVIISTDTKELQIQLINKDIPNVLNSLGLNNKVSYGYIKGKNNYICMDKLEGYKLDYNPKNPKIEDILSLIYIEQLVEDGKYGDIEEINYWVLNHFEEITEHLRYVSCDPNLCRPKKCHRKCLYKNRVEELKEEDITVINHSLLAKWPYKEEKPIENIIVDEAHNLTEKGYDFFSSIIEYRSLKYTMKEIYPYENIGNSAFAYDKKLKKIKMFDKFYNHIHIDRESRDKISRNINLIIEEMTNILEYGNHSEYKNISNYNLKWELNLQQDDVIYKRVTYKNYSEKIKVCCEAIIRNISSILHLIDRNMDDENIDKEADIYKFGKSKFKDLEDIKNILQIFMEYSDDDHIARIIELDQNYNNFEFRVTPLKLADLFEENILSQLNSGIFLSATLSVGNNMSYFKNTLGINRVDNVEKVIKPLYDYKNRVSIIRVEDICDYKNENFPTEMSNMISEISKLTHGRMLSLFNSKDRKDKTYDVLKDYLHKNDTEVYMNKKGIKHLKNINKKCVVLGSKGCFEGVDVPGDGLICVTLDKIPNLNPRDPLYYTIMKKYNIEYYNINYPQMAIKVKQAMGRILRSKYDYGCFVIFNTGNNINTLKRLEKDLHGCKIISKNKNNIYRDIDKHLRYCRKMVLNIVLEDIFRVFNIDESTTLNTVKELVNRELARRYIKGKIYFISEIEKTFKINYFIDNYLINKDIFQKQVNIHKK